MDITIRYVVNNMDDVLVFKKWMIDNNNKYIDKRFKLMILLNIVNSYELLGGNMEFNRTKVKDQIRIMWSYIENNI